MFAAIDSQTMFWVYAGVGTFGFAYAILSGALATVFGGFDHGADAAGHDFDVGHGADLDAAGGPDGHLVGAEVSSAADTMAFSPMSPAVISMFLTCFGASGAALTHLQYPWHESLLGAVLSGFVIGGVTFYLFDRLFKVTQGSSHYRAGEMIGLHAEVIVPIPEHGIGEVCYEVRGMRYNSAGRLQDGGAAARGELLVVTEVSGGTVYLKREHTRGSDGG